MAHEVQVGRYNTLPVSEENRGGFLLGEAPRQVFLPLKEAPPQLAVGAELRVFVYVDSQATLLATTRPARAQVGEFAYLQCVEVSEQGAFLDWGIPKDLFVPFAEQHRRMREGQGYVVAIRLDRHVERPMASSKLGPFFDYRLDGVPVGSKQDLLVFDHNDAGAKVIVAQRFLGLIYTDTTFRELPVGSEHVGYVERLRPDNRIDISLTPIEAGARAEQWDAAQRAILAALGDAGGSLPIGDKSSPAEIQQAFNLSKQAFKRSAGALYRARKIRIEARAIHLVDGPDADS